jgi:hypothetical protein
MGRWSGIGASGTNASTGNIGIGFQTLRDVSASSYNVAIGFNAAENMTTASGNVYNGHQ